MSTEVRTERVLARRVRRHFLAGAPARDAVAVAGRLLGVQAQVTAAADQAVAVRGPAVTAVRDGLADGSLVRTWSVRGTLHVLDTARAPDLLALLAAARTWEKGSWQREFAAADEVARLAELAGGLLADGPLTREELVAGFAPHVSDGLADRLGSGWGTVLKPLAWQGLLVNGPPRGRRPTFTAPPWTTLPDPDAAAARVIPAYLDVYGPASPTAFDDWLLRGGTRRPTLRRWFADLVDAGTITPVDTGDGEPRYARTVDLDELVADEPAPPDHLRFLPAFDTWVLGPGTRAADVLAPEHRGRVSRAAGWIAPVVVRSGRVVGTWSGRDVHDAELFDGGALPPDLVAQEHERWRRILTETSPVGEGGSP
ncbi:DNA glycosylase AlkZ-like family protein [Actinomycetospora soli]|uniref:DNA glycosylase AlkZ-like family protein n=1 Tax=Actinomycetospora soli TaxID=2893887 RepID=UPI001E39C4A6|nr:crosslink repair DNA glycosylase YcaQ family protein [Actinomycetospora soli]MCD2185712.1 winged helix DNA-binding domain-containing protein [Actinomycetospora soli]